MIGSASVSSICIYVTKVPNGHFWPINGVLEIDLRAADLHARGIPIVCNDVPPISPYSEKLLQMYEDMRGSPH